MQDFLAKRRENAVKQPALLPLKELELFADYGNSLWSDCKCESPHDLLPDDLIREIDQWEAMYWEEPYEHEYQAHNLTRAEFNEIGRRLAKRIKKLLPHVVVTHRYWTMQYASDDGCELATETIE